MNFTGSASLARRFYRLRRSFWFNLPLALAAAVWRRLLVRTTFIAVTGSNGKTTTKELLAAILAARHPTHKTRSSRNGRDGLIRTILGARPWHRYAVVEIGVEAPGQMWRAGLLTRPDIAIITSIGREHSENFPSLEAVAREKATLLRALPKNGMAVLNGDDPYVCRMGRIGAVQTYYYGTGAQCHLRASGISATWPQRLRFVAHFEEGTLPVQTQLVGAHWTPHVLAALLAARLCGIGPAEAVRAVAAARPFTARLEPVALPSGATLLRDEFNGSAGTTRIALHVLSEARAARRIAILRDVTDDERPAPERLFDLGRRAAVAADVVIFIGPEADFGAAGARAAGLRPEAVLTCRDVRAAADWLRDSTKPGDLILLKGRNRHHLSRSYLALVTPVTCWRETCEYRHLCDECGELGPRSPVPPHRKSAATGEK